MRKTHLILAVGVSALALALAACSGAVAPQKSTATGAHTTATPTSTASPFFSSQATAKWNLPYLKSVIEQALAAQGNNADATGIAQSLVAGGVPAESISFTPNSTAIGLKADSVSIAVQVGPFCAIGQYGDAIGGLTMDVQPVLAQGGCLIGGDIQHP